MDWRDLCVPTYLPTKNGHVNPSISLHTRTNNGRSFFHRFKPVFFQSVIIILFVDFGRKGPFSTAKVGTVLCQKRVLTSVETGLKEHFQHVLPKKVGIESSLNFRKKSRNLHISTKISILTRLSKPGKNRFKRRFFRPVGTKKEKNRLIAGHVLSTQFPQKETNLCFGCFWGTAVRMFRNRKKSSNKHAGR